MKVVEIFRVQKFTPLLRKICILGWDGENIIILKGQKYGKALLNEAKENGGFLNPVTGKRIPPSRGLAFLKSLYECFKHLSYIEASKIKSARIAYSTTSEGALDAKPAVVKGGKMLVKWRKQIGSLPKKYGIGTVSAMRS